MSVRNCFQNYSPTDNRLRKPDLFRLPASFALPVYVPAVICCFSAARLVMAGQSGRNCIHKRNDNEKADRSYDHQAHGPAAHCGYRGITSHQCPYKTPLSERTDSENVHRKVFLVRKASCIRIAQAVTRVTRVISDGAPKRLGGPQ